MFLSKLFRNARAKVMIALVGLTLVFGTVTSFFSAWNNSSISNTETLAGSLDDGYIYTNAAGNDWAQFKCKVNGDQLESYNMYFEVGQVFRYRCHWDNWFDADVDQDPQGGKGSCFEKENYGGHNQAKCKTAGFYNLYFKVADRRVYIESGSYKTAIIDYSAASSEFSATKYIHWGVANDSYSIGTKWQGVSGLVTSAGANKVSVKYSASANVLVFSDTDTQTVDITPHAIDNFTYYVWNAQDNGKYVGHWGATSVGTFVVGDFNDWLGTSSSILASNDGSSNYYVRTNVTMAANDEWLIRVVSSWNADDQDYGWSSFSFDYSEANDSEDLFAQGTSVNTNIKAQASGTYDIHYYVQSSTHIVFGYYASSSSISEGYYLCGTNEFTTNASFPFSLKYGIKMSEGDGINTAYLSRANGIYVSGGTRLKPRHHCANSKGSNTWYNVTLCGPGAGGRYDFAYVDSSDENNVKFETGASGYYNFYFKIVDTTYYLYIVDVGEIHTYGYLYIASTAAASTIGVTTKKNSGTQVVVDNHKLDTFTGFEYSANVYAFDSKTNVNLYRVPIYNLRGSSADSVVDTVVYNDGSEKTLTSIPNATTTPHVFAAGVAGGSSSAVSNTSGLAAKAVFELDEAMNGNSLCEMEDDWSTLKALIETGYSNDSSLMNGAQITSLPSQQATGSENWTVRHIYWEICRRLGVTPSIDAWKAGSFMIPNNGSKKDDSPLTITLWIVMGAGLAGLAAIGAAYFVSKKKRNRA